MFTSIRHRISIIACTIATAALGVEFSMASKAAYAVVDLLTCTGPYTASYNPGLTLLEPKQTVVSFNSTPFTCLISTDPTITSATSNSGAVTITASCTLATSPGEYEATYYWSNGNYSKVVFKETVQAKPGGQTVFISFGEVKEGQFQGAKATRNLTLFALDLLQCATPSGVTSATGTDTIELTGL
ncbi:hypothetical protein HW132_30520 [Brasilonema sp. CT11]|nr:hypothetical protein [Brasilonema sp. CT11]